MHSLARVILGAGLIVVACSFALERSAHAQGGGQAPVPASARATVADPDGPKPDASHIPFVLPADIKWTGNPGGMQQAVLWGDPTKEGSYGVIIKWPPGQFSHPHFHDQTRWIYVVSGTWWVSTSNVYDEHSTYPLHAGTFSSDVVNTVHYDGCRTGEKEPAVILLSGMGPVKTIQVDETGKPRAARGQ